MTQLRPEVTYICGKHLLSVKDSEPFAIKSVQRQSIPPSPILPNFCQMKENIGLKGTRSLAVTCV